jgi:hypothetical protein
MRIPDNYLDRLRNAGLVISEEPFVPDHVAYPNGHIVGKPRETLGNSIPEMEGYWGYTGIVLNAPTIYFYRARGKWVVAVEDWVPGPGPGDFVHAHDTPEGAIDDILDYYFGDPERMNSRLVR